jgi:PD-(D/E)XK endonuclease
MLGLQAAGFMVSVPFGENTRYDLIADDGEKLLRVQCKTGRLRNGVVLFATCSFYGHHPNPKITHRDYHGDVDAFGVYCMRLGGVYLVPISELPNQRMAALRIAPPLNNQHEKVRFANDYEIALVDLVPTARPRGSSGAG